MGERIGILVKGPFDKKSTERLVECVATKEGLAVHAHPPGVMSNWTVTHIGSGLALARGGASSRDAIAVMEKLLPLADWYRSEDDLKSVWETIGTQATKIIESQGMTRVKR